MGDIAIRADGLSKRYRLGRRRRRHETLRDQLADGLRTLFRRDGADRPRAEEFWALKDISFEVNRGEIVGIIGRNGAGKSTLLKILSRITEPTSGQAELHGRVSSLLEVGTGFHPELTGRENVFLNGTIMGMSRAEIRRKFDEIVAFAEIEAFIDTPVKRYSSGMYVRLAFAVAAHMEPEILVIDEVLAVGDSSFQRKCLGKIEQVKDGGRTVLFVGHNMATISHLCTRGIVLSAGSVAFDGEPPLAIAEYLKSLGRPAVGEAIGRSEDGRTVLVDVRVEDDRGDPVGSVLCGQDVSFRMLISSKMEIEDVTVTIGVDDSLQNRVFLLANTLMDRTLRVREGMTELLCAVPRLPLRPGNYTLSPKLSSRKGTLIWAPNSVPLRVEGGDFFGSGRIIEAPWMGTTLVAHDWATA